jgi:hypothetical protein
LGGAPGYARKKLIFVLSPGSLDVPLRQESVHIGRCLRPSLLGLRRLREGRDQLRTQEGCKAVKVVPDLASSRFMALLHLPLVDLLFINGELRSDGLIGRRSCCICSVLRLMQRRHLRGDELELGYVRDLG